MNISKCIVLADSTSSECKIIKAEALDGMILIVTFSNNEERLFDASLLKVEVFEPLKNYEIFNDFNVEYGTITWLNGSIDIAPEYVYQNSTQYS